MAARSTRSLLKGTRGSALGSVRVAISPRNVQGKSALDRLTAYVYLPPYAYNVRLQPEESDDCHDAGSEDHDESDRLPRVRLTRCPRSARGRQAGRHGRRRAGTRSRSFREPGRLAHNDGLAVPRALAGRTAQAEERTTGCRLRGDGRSGWQRRHPVSSSDEVFGGRRGAFAEYVCVRDAIAPKPAGLTFEEAAAVPLAAITALQGLRDKGQVRPGQKVLINGTSGGVGTFAVQIGRASCRERV